MLIGKSDFVVHLDIQLTYLTMYNIILNTIYYTITTLNRDSDIIALS